MELVQELILTAVFAVVFSFLVAKIVSMAMGGGSDCGSDFDSKPGKEVAEDIIMEELVLGEKLKVQGFESEKRVEFVEEVVTRFDQFDQKTVEVPEIAESENLGRVIITECCQLKKEEEEEVVELAKKSEVVVEEKEAKIDDSVEIESSENDNEIVAQFKEEEEMKVVESELEGGNDDDDDEIVAQSAEEEEEKVVESELKEGNEEVVDIDDDEDDWEGIERSELEKVFSAAAKFVEKVELASLGSDLLMELYGLHKVATEGPCRESQPMALMVSARAKWNAWQRLGNMSPEVAMEQYIALLSDKVPRWLEDNCAVDSKLESPEAGISSSIDPDLSTLSPHQPNLADERNPELKPCAEGGDVTGGSSLENKAKE